LGEGEHRKEEGLKGHPEASVLAGRNLSKKTRERNRYYETDNHWPQNSLKQKQDTNEMIIKRSPKQRQYPGR